MPEYYTCKEIATRYKVKTLTVWNWIRKKKMPAIKIGKEYRIKQEDIETFEKGRKTA